MSCYILEKLRFWASFQPHFHVVDPKCDTSIERTWLFPCFQHARQVFIVLLRALRSSFSLRQVKLFCHSVFVQTVKNKWIHNFKIPQNGRRDSCKVSCSSSHRHCSAGSHRRRHSWISSIHHYRHIHTFLQSTLGRAQNSQSLPSRCCSYKLNYLELIISHVLWLETYIKKRKYCCFGLTNEWKHQQKLHSTHPWTPRSAPGMGSRVEHLSSLWLKFSQLSSSEESSQSSSPLQRRDWLMQRPGEMTRQSHSHRCPWTSHLHTESALSKWSLRRLARFFAGEALSAVIRHQTLCGCCRTCQLIPQGIETLCATKLWGLLQVSEAELSKHVENKLKSAHSGVHIDPYKSTYIMLIM